MSQATKKKKIRIAAFWACPAAVDARWSQIRRFGSTPKKGDSILSPKKYLTENYKFTFSNKFTVINQPHTLVKIVSVQ